MIQIGVLFRRGYKKRAEYLKKHHVFHECGENVRIQSRKVPLYGNLISFHNNISVASNVTFLTHDVMHTVFGTKTGDYTAFQENVGCIEIFDNVFIGSNTTIMNNVRIGPNAIVAGGAVVTHDVPPGTIVAGVPARVIGSFDDVMQRRMVKKYPAELAPRKQRCSPELEAFLWEQFRNAETEPAGKAEEGDCE